MGAVHESWKDEVKGILEYYEFDVKKEYILPSGERIDVVGWCNREKPWRGKSVAVEIEKTSPLEKDVDKLRRSGFDLKFVIRFTRKDLPAEVGDVTIVYPPRSFENILRLMLKVPPTYPIRPSLSEAPVLEPKPRQLAELLESVGWEILCKGGGCPTEALPRPPTWTTASSGIATTVWSNRVHGDIGYSATSQVYTQWTRTGA